MWTCKFEHAALSTTIKLFLKGKMARWRPANRRSSRQHLPSFKTSLFLKLDKFKSWISSGGSEVCYSCTLRNLHVCGTIHIFLSCSSRIWSTPPALGISRQTSWQQSVSCTGQSQYHTDCLIEIRQEEGVQGHDLLLFHDLALCCYWDHPLLALSKT